jgi:hypothetical protein
MLEAAEQTDQEYGTNSSSSVLQQHMAADVNADVRNDRNSWGGGSFNSRSPIRDTLLLSRPMHTSDKRCVTPGTGMTFKANTGEKPALMGGTGVQSSRKLVEEL